MRFSVNYLLTAALVAQTAHALQSPLQRTQQTASVLEDWQLLDNGCVVGKIKGNPAYNDGDVITTSPLSNPTGATEASFVTSQTGSSYLLGTPRFASPSYGGTRPIGGASNEMPREDFVQNFLQVFGLTSLVAGGTALGFTVGGSGTGGDAVVATTDMAKSMTDMTSMTMQSPSDAWMKSSPGLVEAPKGDSLSPSEVRDLFSLWNNALMTGNPDTVAMRYSKEAVLLPTKSDIPRSDYEGIRDYFVHFLEKRPTGRILESYGKRNLLCQDSILKDTVFRKAYYSYCLSAPFQNFDQFHPSQTMLWMLVFTNLRSRTTVKYVHDTPSSTPKKMANGKSSTITLLECQRRRDKLLVRMKCEDSLACGTTLC